MKWLLWMGSVMICFSLAAEEPSCTEELQQNPTWLGKVRTKSLEGLDDLLAFSINYASRTYVLSTPLEKVSFRVENSEILDFFKSHNYFSPVRPIVAKVTKDKEDIFLTCCLLKKIGESIQNPRQRSLMVLEVLAKVLAYRDLKLGTQIPIPTMGKNGEKSLTTYEVDRVFDIWQGMPAFGLIPKDNMNAPPLLIFRGTDISLLSKRGWASLISDLDPKGPGLSAFRHAQPSLHDWLARVSREHSKARVVGFSLGGVLAIYTSIYESELLAKDVPTVAFDSPGVSKEVFETWKNLENRPPLLMYATKGDYIPKLGLLIGDIWELTNDMALKPLAAHTTCITGESEYSISAINLTEENSLRK